MFYNCLADAFALPESRNLRVNNYRISKNLLSHLDSYLKDEDRDLWGAKFNGKKINTDNRIILYCSRDKGLPVRKNDKLVFEFKVKSGSVTFWTAIEKK